MKKEICKIVIKYICKVIKTATQMAVGSIGANAIIMSDVNWKFVGSATILGVITCAIMNFADMIGEIENVLHID